MTKEELLRELAGQLSLGAISREEIASYLGDSQGAAGISKPKHFSAGKMLYVLGAAIVVIGLVIFVRQIWTDIGTVGRVAVTLGFGLLFAALGSVLFKKKPVDSIGAVFHLIGGLLIPGGAIVTLNELGADIETFWPLVIAFGAIFVFYLLLNSIHKSALLAFFVIANGTALVYFLVTALFLDEPPHWFEDLYAYLTMIIGASYLLLARAWRVIWNDKLVGLLYFLGSAGFLAAAFSRVFDSTAWQALYFLIVILGLYLAVRVKSRGILIVSTLFLIAHISYITNEYFRNSLGWPMALVLLGLIFIGLGYGSFAINRKYLT